MLASSTSTPALLGRRRRQAVELCAISRGRRRAPTTLRAASPSSRPLSLPPPPPPTSAALGIDLGTTHSVVAVVEPSGTSESDESGRRPQARVVLFEEGPDNAPAPSALVPSVVAFLGPPPTKPLVGAPAARQAPQNPLNTFYSVKRLIGRSMRDPEVRALVEGGGLVFGVEEEEGGDGGASSSSCSLSLPCPALGRPLRPEDVSAEVVRHLVVAAAGKNTTKNTTASPPFGAAVVTVPARFSAQQRAATLRAVEAGFSKAGDNASTSSTAPRLALIAEPVAAAVAFGYGPGANDGRRGEKRKRKRRRAVAAAENDDAFDDDPDQSPLDVILVVDLGGGTYDVSLVESFEGLLEVVATGGDGALGGDDWDRLLAEEALRRATGAGGAAVTLSELSSLDAGAAAALLRSAERAKVTLSDGEDDGAAAAIAVPLVPAAGAGPTTTTTVQITRADLDSTTKPLIERLGAPLEALARDASLELPPRKGEGAAARQPPRNEDKYAPPPRRLTDVVLVGGATRLPAVRAWAREATGLEPRGGGVPEEDDDEETALDPERAVAVGAALQAAALLGVKGAGLEVADGGFMAEAHGGRASFGSSDV